MFPCLARLQKAPARRNFCGTKISPLQVERIKLQYTIPVITNCVGAYEKSLTLTLRCIVNESTRIRVFWGAWRAEIRQLTGLAFARDDAAATKSTALKSLKNTVVSLNHDLENSSAKPI